MVSTPTEPPGHTMPSLTTLPVMEPWPRRVPPVPTATSPASEAEGEDASPTSSVPAVIVVPPV
jgi:hypothetical protein